MRRREQPETGAAASQRLARSAPLDRLYRQYAGWLGRTLAARFRSTAVEVDDLVQETYVRVSRYAPDEANRHPKELLMKIAINLSRDHMRRNVVRGGLDRAELDEAELVPTTADQHQAAMLKDIILKLPPIYRDVFVLHRFTGLTYEEIASHVGISVKTVEWRMSRALAMCVKQLED